MSKELTRDMFVDIIATRFQNLYPSASPSYRIMLLDHEATLRATIQQLEARVKVLEKQLSERLEDGTKILSES